MSAITSIQLQQLYAFTEDTLILYYEDNSTKIYKIILPKLSINEELGKTLKIYPNPASDYLQIEGNNIQNIQLYDVVGKIIFQNNEINSMYSTKIMTNKLSNGIYFFKINTNNKLITKKIIKQ